MKILDTTFTVSVFLSKCQEQDCTPQSALRVNFYVRQKQYLTALSVIL
jgi:hypothetical protein